MLSKKVRTYWEHTNNKLDFKKLRPHTELTHRLPRALKLMHDVSYYLFIPNWQIFYCIISTYVHLGLLLASFFMKNDQIHSIIVHSEY